VKGNVEMVVYEAVELNDCSVSKTIVFGECQQRVKIVVYGTFIINDYSL
jgi:hypothetical protein